MPGELKKLWIDAYTDPEYSGSATGRFTVMFNPDSYTVKYALEYDDKDQGLGTTGLPQRYKKSKPSEFSLEFTLDGTGASREITLDGTGASGELTLESGEITDVSGKIEEFLSIVYKYDGSIHRPPFLKLAWGTLLFNCVFKAADVQYTLFNPDGSPLRAAITATFIGYVDDVKSDAERGDSSPDLTRLHIVKEGETLPLLAHRYYGALGHYMALARFNGLNNFSDLVDGQQLVLPPLAKN